MSTENETNVTGMVRVDEEMGKSLVEGARELIRKRLTEQAVGEVETVMQLIAVTEERKATEERKLAHYKARLAAIESGQIRVTRNAAGAVSIRYIDEKLNQNPS